MILFIHEKILFEKILLSSLCGTNVYLPMGTPYVYITYTILYEDLQPFIHKIDVQHLILVVIIAFHWMLQPIRLTSETREA